MRFLPPSQKYLLPIGIQKRNRTSQLSLTSLSLTSLFLHACGGGGGVNINTGGDTVKPSLASTTQALSIANDKKTLTVLLSETIKSIDTSKISVLNQDTNTPLPINTITFNSSTLTITLVSPISKNGNYSVAFQAGAFTDASGNKNTTITTEADTITDSTTSPSTATPTLTTPSSLTNDTTPDITITGGTAGDTVNIYEGNNLIASGIIGAGGTLTITLTSPLSNGVHTLTAKFQNGSGEGPSSTPLTLTVDSVKPELLPGGNALAISGDKKTFTVTLSETIDTVDKNLISVLKSGTTATLPITSATINNNNTLVIVLTDAISTDGDYLVTFKAGAITDLAGNTNSLTSTEPDPITDSTTNPPFATPTLITSSPLTNDTTPDITITGGVAGDTVNIYENTTKIASGIIGAGGTLTITLSSPLSNAIHTLTAKFQNTNGEGPSSTTLTLTIDTVKPELLSGGNALAIADDKKTFTVSLSETINATDSTKISVLKQGTNTPLSVATVRLDNKTLVITLTNPINDTGNYLVTFNAGALTDLAGNTNDLFSTEADTITITISVPTATPTLTTPSSLTNDTTPDITITGGTTGDTVNIYENTTKIASGIIGAGGTLTITLTSPLSNGVHTLTAKFQNGSGEGPSSTPLTLTVDSVKPELSSGGNALAISGDKKTFTVTLSETIDTVNIDLISVLKSGTTATLPITSATIVNNSTLVITLTNPINTSGDYLVTFKAGALTDLAGNTNSLTSTEADTITDSTTNPPTLVNTTNALAINADMQTLIVTFNENITFVDKSLISLLKKGTSGSLLIESASFSGSTVTINLADPITSTGDYRLKFLAGAVKDNTNNSNEELFTEYDNVTTGTPPSTTPLISLLDGASLSLTNDTTPRIKVTSGTPGDTVNFYENNTNIGSKIIRTDGSATLSLPLTNGTHNITADFENKNGKGTKSLTLAITIDAEAPTLSSDTDALAIASDKKTLVVTLSENITLVDKNLISVVENNNNFFLAVSNVVANNKTLTITLASPPRTSGLYKVKISEGAIQDSALNNNITLTTESDQVTGTAGTSGDTTPPDLIPISQTPFSIGKDLKTLTVKFTEAIGSIDKSKITWSGKTPFDIFKAPSSITPPDIDTITTSGSTVTLILVSPIEVGDYYIEFNIGAVADLKGNANTVTLRTHNAFIRTDDVAEPSAFNDSLSAFPSKNELVFTFRGPITLVDISEISVYTGIKKSVDIDSVIGSGTLISDDIVSIKESTTNQSEIIITLAPDTLRSGYFRVDFGTGSVKNTSNGQFLREAIYSNVVQVPSSNSERPTTPPILTLLNEDPDSPINDNTPSIKISGGKIGDAVYIYDGGSSKSIASGTLKFGGNLILTLPTLSEGLHSLTAKFSTITKFSTINGEGPANSPLAITIDTVKPSLASSTEALAISGDNKTFTVTLSEDVDTVDKNLISVLKDGTTAALPITSTTIINNNTLVITLTNPINTDGNYKVTFAAEAFTDLAGNPNALLSTEVDPVLSDNTPPTLITGGNALTINPNNQTLIVSFSEIINSSPALINKSKISVLKEGSNTPLSISTATATNTTLTITLSQAINKSGDYKVTFLAGAVQDLAGNKNLLTSTEPDTITLDTSPPTLGGNALLINADNQTLVVTFSETINFADKNLITVLKKDASDSLLIDSVSFSGSTVTINLANPITSTGEYQVKFFARAVKDLANNPNAELTTEYDPVTGAPPSAIPTISLLDGASPSLTNDTTPRIKAIGGTLGDTVNFYKGNTNIGSKIIGTDGSATLSLPLSAGLHTITAKFQNKNGEGTTASPPLSITIDTIAPSLSSNTNALSIAGSTLTVTLNENITLLDKKFISVVDNNNNSFLGISSIAANTTTLTITLASPIRTTGNYRVKLLQGAVQDTAGNANLDLSTEADQVTGTAGTGGDTTPPALIPNSQKPFSIEKDLTTLTVKFTKTIGYIDKSKITWSGKTATFFTTPTTIFPPDIDTITTSGSTVTLILVAPITKVGTYTIAFNNGSVADLKGNTNTEKLTTHQVFILTTDTDVPKLESNALAIDIAAKKFTVTFTENITLDDPSGISVYTGPNASSVTGTGTLISDDIVSVSASGKTIVITLSQDLSSSGRFRVDFDTDSVKNTGNGQFFAKITGTEIDALPDTTSQFFISAINNTPLKDSKPTIPQGSKDSPNKITVTGLSDSTFTLKIEGQTLAIANGFIATGETSATVTLSQPLPSGTVTIFLEAYNQGTLYSSALKIEADPTTTIVTPSFDTQDFLALHENDQFLIGTPLDTDTLL